MDQDDDICPKNNGQRHVPDWNSVSITHDGETHIDVNCKLCGRSGCIGIAEDMEKDIRW